ncbi:MAG: class I SAM-dependent methyltransferase, partial [Anaerolineae bacterium]|nr:class I SAM-dependent methyltransferase [Anaerolineae bacterium]
MDSGAHPLNWRLRLYLWATRLLYGPLAWAYDAVSWAVSLGRWASWRRRALDLVAGHRVLELGFGTGDLLAEMARRGFQGVGVEPSAAMQRTASRKLSRRGLGVPRVRAVAQALPFRDGAFDAVVATFPSEYILDP